MKKKALLLGLLFVLVLGGGIFLVEWLVIAPSRPRFVPATKPVALGAYDWVNFDYLHPSPFEGGKLWVETFAKKEVHVYLFDLEKREILGELFKGWPAVMNGDQSRLLCTVRTRGPTNAFRQAVMQALAALPVTKRYFSHAGQDAEIFWVLDLKRNAATRLGRMFQWNGAGSDFKPSPNFRRAFNKPTGSFNSPELFICDLNDAAFRKDQVDGWPCGWWDNERILMKATNNDLVLYDLTARKISPLVSQQQLAAFLTKVGLTNAAGLANPFFQWNGKENEFYLTDGNMRWSAKESYLIKLERPGGTLKLVDPHFKFEWGDHFDAGENYYLYCGRERGETNSAVYLRDLKTGRIRELVPRDANNTNSFSVPQFYGDKVIYLRSNALWEMGVDGGGNRRVFPP